MSNHRDIRVRGIRRRKVDASKLGRALIELAQAQAEKEAQAEHEARKRPDASDKPKRPRKPPRSDGRKDPS